MRNLILAGALLFTAGIVYAQEATEADATEATETTETWTRTPPRPTRTPTTVIGQKTKKEFFELKDIVKDDAVTGYYWDAQTNYSGWNANDPKFPKMENAKQNGGWYNLSSTLVRYDKESFAYTVFDAGNTDNEWKALLSVVTDEDGNVIMEESSNLINYRDVYDYYVEKDPVTGKASLVKGEFLRRVYYFSVPVGEVEYWQKDEDGHLVLNDKGKRIPLSELKYPVTKLGVLVGDVSSIENPDDPNLFYVIDSKQNETLKKNYYLAFGDSANADNRTDPEIAFGQPLPAPFATLLIALCFGAAFVIYRNRKQAA